MVRVGNCEISDIRIGSAKIAKACVGGDVVWEIPTTGGRWHLSLKYLGSHVKCDLQYSKTGFWEGHGISIDIRLSFSDGWQLEFLFPNKRVTRSDAKASAKRLVFEDISAITEITASWYAS